MEKKIEYKNIFFDLDRTLWDFETNSLEVLQEIYDHFNLYDLGIINCKSFIYNYKKNNERLWGLYRENKINQLDLRRDRFYSTLKFYGVNNISLSEDIGKFYTDVCPKKTKLFPNVIESLDYLHQKYDLHIITNGFKKTQHIKLTYSNLLKYFKFVITSEEIGYKKPNSEIFRFALKKANANKFQSVYVGDDLIVDIMGCQKFGIDGIYFNPNKNQHSKIVKYEIHNFNQLKDIL